MLCQVVSPLCFVSEIDPEKPSKCIHMGAYLYVPDICVYSLLLTILYTVQGWAWYGVCHKGLDIQREYLSYPRGAPHTFSPLRGKKGMFTYASRRCIQDSCSSRLGHL